MLALCVLAGCGRIAFDPFARTDGAIVVDAAAPFGTPVPLTPLNSAFADDDPTLTGDLLEIIFDSERASPTGDLYVSTRTAITDAWPAATVISELVSVEDEDAPNLAKDGLTLWFSRTNGASTDIFMSTRATRATPWSTPVIVTELMSGSDDDDFSASSDELVAVFDSLRSGPSAELFAASRGSKASMWGSVRELVELNLAGTETRDPFLDAMGTTLVFVSNRTGGYDLLRATRSTVDAAFAGTTPLAEI